MNVQLRKRMSSVFIDPDSMLKQTFREVNKLGLSSFAAKLDNI